MKNPETAVRLYDAWLTFVEDQEDEGVADAADDLAALRAGFIYQRDDKILAKVADDNRVETCRIWAGEKELGYSCTCAEKSFCPHLALICAEYFTEGGEPALFPEAFAKAFGDDAAPEGVVEYHLDHFASDGFPSEEADDAEDDDEDGDGDFDDNEDDDDIDVDDEDDEGDDDGDDWGGLSGDPDDEEEAVDNAEDIAAQRQKARACVAKSMQLLRDRLKADGAGLSLGLVTALAEQDEQYRLRLLYTLGLRPDGGGGFDEELLSAFLDDIVNPAPWPTYQVDDLEEDIEFTDKSLDFPDRFGILLKVFRELLWHGGDKTALAVLRHALADPENRQIAEFIALDHAGQFQMQALTLLQR